jgi:hypothetical protein
MKGLPAIVKEKFGDKSEARRGREGPGTEEL